MTTPLLPRIFSTVICYSSCSIRKRNWARCLHHSFHLNYSCSKKAVLQRFINYIIIQMLFKYKTLCRIYLNVSNLKKSYYSFLGLKQKCCDHFCKFCVSSCCIPARYISFTILRDINLPWGLLQVYQQACVGSSKTQ